MNYVTVKPFVKWAGGKSQLLEKIRTKYPKNIEKYCEPFLGGGAVLFDILINFHPQEVLVNDINRELINTYRQIQSEPDKLIGILLELQSIFWDANLSERKLIYMQKREEFNTLKIDTGKNTEKAALFIFLNKTCFNGLYRVNSKGLFNVPMGSYKWPPICDEKNIKLCSQLLKNVQISCADFFSALDFIDSKTFVYLDPPYRPISETSFFTSYSEFGFTDQEQRKLKDFVDAITKKRARAVISNSDPKNNNADDNFFDDLYKKYKIDRIAAKRMINSRASKRGNINELLIYNF
ncbi:DNA adenine methylase [Treponema sp. OMZ 799]|uniref:DNA adenine methylase n=1 Tax=Treponema sp. OMZ 799 TaxID=2563668 RepID=UPI0020A33ED6|nr:DNA adenine methylase [Treponema sp. OMZ 799]UTC77670.1 DNA adenine methylase [Treponema sp. OMZ 799]